MYPHTPYIILYYSTMTKWVTKPINQTTETPTHFFFADHKWQKTHVGSSSRELNLVSKRWERKDKEHHHFLKTKK